MGSQKRSVDSGRKDSLGRAIKVSDGVADQRPTAPPPPADIDLGARNLTIAKGGYAAGLATSAANPWPRRDPSPWWDNRQALAEHNHHRGDYPEFPETGLNQDQNLRTYRRCYEGNGTAVRMPSRAAIDRYTKQNPGTFDLPVEVATPAGNVSSNVRCTQVASGVWHVTPTSKNPSTAEIAAAEAVRAVLEAQRPTMALRQVGDLVAKAETRAPRGAIRTKPINNSSFVQQVGFGRGTPVVTVKMHDTTYAYKVPSENAQQFLAAVRDGRGIGSAYNKFVKGSDRVEARPCSRCKALVPRGPGLPLHTCEVHGKRPQR